MQKVLILIAKNACMHLHGFKKRWKTSGIVHVSVDSHTYRKSVSTSTLSCKCLSVYLSLCLSGLQIPTPTP